MSTVECPNCGSSTPAENRFCPECGRPLGEVAPTPTAVDEPRRSRWLPDAPLVLVLLIAVGGIILLVAGLWAWGLAALLLAGLVFLSQREVERRAARLTLAALAARLSAHREVMTARSRGQLELFRARRELAELQADRARGFHELGRAAFEEDEAGMEAAKTALVGIGERIEQKEAEIQALIKEIDERVRRAQAPVVPTEKLDAEEAPEPVTEPWPPPDEGEPPSPEPVPEPSPEDEPPTPEHPPMPETKAAKKGC